MKNIKQICLLLGIFILTQNSYAQLNPIKKYTEDPVVFLEEIKIMFEVTNMDKRELKDFMVNFTAAWNQPKCNPKLKAATYEVCNMMITKKNRILPDYKVYLTSVMNFINSSQSESNFAAWQDCILKVLGGKNKRDYTTYLEMSENLFASNTFYNSSVVRYSSSNSDFKFEFDEVPTVVFPSFNLRCHNNQNDSGVVYNTKGVYYPFKGVFVGEGGTVNWERTGLKQDKVWAELNNYQITLKTSGFTADSARFYNKMYFEKSILGSVTERVISQRGDNISYPRFESYSKRMEIPNLAKNVDYDGGFSMRGSKFIGSGDSEKDALLIFKRDDKPFMIIGAQSIGITAEKFNAEAARIKIYIDKDSITHPSANVKFMVADRKVVIIRTDKGVSKSPFLNSYHKIDMYFEQMDWLIDEPLIDIKMLAGNSQGDGRFESANYFRNSAYDNLQGMDQMNPLIQLRNFVNQNGGERSFSGYDYANFMRFPLRDVLPILVRLSGLGLISYDAQNDRAYVNDKAFNYIKARAGKIDYDVIQFASEVRGESNAKIDLNTYDMSIFGVKKIFMSDSQNVAIYPAEQKILLKKNRDFIFEGVIQAGRFILFGKEFSFEYDKFLLNLLNVDSVLIMVEAITENAYGEKPLTKVKTVIEKINGSLEIDDPQNKSGRKPFSKYPIFTSFKDSYAYYDKKSVQNGKYPRESFYFHLDPFVIDSLDNFSNEGLDFKGEFVSADIFPTIKESLKLQPDYSLGFINKSPATGYQAYGGKGVFSNDVNLSNRGLRGDGTLTYITSVSKSDDFIFFPDSTNATAQTFTIVETKNKPEFPEVNGELVKVHWMPYKDLLEATNHPEKKFSTYNKQSEFMGLLSVTPEILKGKGTADFSNAKMDANLILFQSNSFDSDTADFSLKALQEASLAFSTKNVNAHVDFSERMGEFKSNGKGSIVEFPINKYICFMESFKWHMDEGTIEIGDDSETAAADTKRDLDLEGPEFISVHPKQDSLRFHALSAKYDLKTFVIAASKVEFIKVADAQLFPDSGKVFVDKNAVMRTFTNAKIIANQVTKYHHLYNCTLNAYGRQEYSGSGSYDYIDEMKTKQTFYFSNISVDTTFETYAETKIPASTKFKLSPNYEYQGKVKLKASNNFLVFDGTTRIAHECEGISRTWFRFESEINPDLIYIPISKDLNNAAGKPVGSALMIDNDSMFFYSAFLSDQKTKQDISVLAADGYLFYDKISNEYRISNKEKLIERALPGNYLSLNTDRCNIYGEGKMDLGGKLGQVKMESFGAATHSSIDDSTKFETMTTLDFMFDEGALESMAQDMLYNKDLSPVEPGRPIYEKGLLELMGKEKADKLIAQLNLFGSFKKLPDELKKTIVFSDLKLVWDKKSRSYNSVGKIGIANIGKTQVNKYVNGRIELSKRPTGDVLNVYLELDYNNWYYFNYTRELLLTVTSNVNFNTIVKDLKADKRKNAGAGSQDDYSYTLCPPAKKTQFLRKGRKLTEDELLEEGE